LFQLIAKRPQTVGDLSAVVTGLLLALSLSTRVTLWQCAVGAAFATVIVKCVFGGNGHNFANPAVTARVMLLVAFTEVSGGAMTGFAELSAGATPLAVLGGETGTLPSILDMVIGNRGGAIGEGCAVLLLVGFVYLLIRRVISWQVPVVFVGTVFLLSLLLTQSLTDALYHVLGGGLLLGAIFMATDPVTTPHRTLGRIVFALGAAVLTVLIRFYVTNQEGVSFAILFMNILTPYLNKLSCKKENGGEVHEEA
jgi:electron transport complex protein RnfD